jgi:hypothetical protein
VYKIDTTGQETVLHTFTGGADGSLPYGNLLLDSAGTLYGTASGGGSRLTGVVFKLIFDSLRLSVAVTSCSI